MKFSKLIKPELEEIARNANFTEEEIEIYKLLARDKSLEEISQKLLLSKATISRRIENIKAKTERVIDMAEKVPIWEKVALTIEETAEYSNIGINRINDMLKDPGCTFVLNVGKKRLVKRKEFEKYIQKTNEV